MEQLDQGLPNEKAFILVGIDVYLVSFTIFVTRLEINKIVLIRQINSNTHQYAATLFID